MAWSGSIVEHPENAGKLMSWAADKHAKTAFETMKYFHPFMRSANLRGRALGRMVYLQNARKMPWNSFDTQFAKQADAAETAGAALYIMYELWIIQVFYVPLIDQLGPKVGLGARIALPMLTQFAKFGLSMGMSTTQLSVADVVDGAGQEGFNAMYQSATNPNALSGGGMGVRKSPLTELQDRPMTQLAPKSHYTSQTGRTATIKCVVGQIAGGRQDEDKRVEGGSGALVGGHFYTVGQATPLRHSMGELRAFHQSTGIVGELRWGQKMMNKFVERNIWETYTNYRGALEGAAAYYVPEHFYSGHGVDYFSSWLRASGSGNSWKATPTEIALVGSGGDTDWVPWLNASYAAKPAQMIADCMGALK